MARWADIVTRVKGIVGDSTDAEAQAWINEAARELNAETGYYTLDTVQWVTVAGTGLYLLPTGLIAVQSLLVNAEPYTLVTASDMERLDAGVDKLVGRGGVYAEYFNDTGARQVRIRPTPTVNGQQITGRFVWNVVPDWTGDPPFPAHFDRVLIAGAVSQGLLEKDERVDLSEFWRAQFEQGKTRLRLDKQGRMGRRAVTLRMHG